MARHWTSVPTPQTVTVVGTVLPAAPEDVNEVATTPTPAGVYRTAGAKLLQIDVAGSNAADTGNSTIAVYAWNRRLQQWCFISSNSVAVLPTGSLGTAATQATRLTVANWGADYAAVMVTALPTGGHPVNVTCSPTVEDT